MRKILELSVCAYFALSALLANAMEDIQFNKPPIDLSRVRTGILVETRKDSAFPVPTFAYGRPNLRHQALLNAIMEKNEIALNEDDKVRIFWAGELLLDAEGRVTQLNETAGIHADSPKLFKSYSKRDCCPKTEKSNLPSIDNITSIEDLSLAFDAIRIKSVKNLDENYIRTFEILSEGKSPVPFLQNHDLASPGIKFHEYDSKKEGDLQHFSESMNDIKIVRHDFKSSYIDHILALYEAKDWIDEECFKSLKDMLVLTLKNGIKVLGNNNLVKKHMSLKAARQVIEVFLPDLDFAGEDWNKMEILVEQVIQTSENITLKSAYQEDSPLMRLTDLAGRLSNQIRNCNKQSLSSIVMIQD